MKNIVQYLCIKYFWRVEMDSNLLLIILNIAFVAILVFGFLAGLSGLKKSGLNFVFFLIATILTFIFTPLITKTVLQISITVDGTTQTISEYIVSLINQSGLVGDIAVSGSSTEALIKNLPQMLGNIVVFMALLIVSNIIFGIIGAIVGAIAFRTKKDKNPVSKNTPSYVSATGNVRYVRTEKPKKRRLAGGFVGLAHALMFAVLLLIPICSLSQTVTALAYETETETTATSVVLADDGEVEYTPFAKQLQSIIPQQVLDILNTVNNSALCKVINVCDSGSLIFNNIAKCEVNGEKVSLKTEITSLASVYNNVEFLASVDMSTAQSIKDINFDKLRTALDNLFDSGIIKTIVPETLDKVLDWLTMDDISSLSTETQDIVKPIRDELAKNEYLNDFVLKFRQVYEKSEKQTDFLKNELYVVVDTCELIANTQIVDEYFGTDLNKFIDTIFDELAKNNSELANKLINKVFDSEVVQIAGLVGTNLVIDELQEYFDSNLSKDATIVQIRKIDVKSATSKFDKTSVSDALTNFLNLYNEYKELDNIQSDIRVLDTPTLETNFKTLGSIVDKIKNLDVLNEFGSLSDILDNLSQLEFILEKDDGTEEKYVASDFVNLALLKDKTFSVESDFETLAPAIRQLVQITFVDEQTKEEHDILWQMQKVGMKDTIKALSSEQTSNILTPLASSELFKPLNVVLINIINEEVQKTIGGDIAKLVPEDVDLSEQVDDIVEIIDDVKTLLPALEEISSGDKNLDDVIKDTATSNSEIIASLLNNLQDNANTFGESGAFTGVYNAMLDYVKDESNGLTGIADIIDSNTTTDGSTTIIDWSKVISDYLKQA